MNITSRASSILNISQIVDVTSIILPKLSREFLLTCSVVIMVILSAFGVVYCQDLHRCLLIDAQRLQSTYHRLQVEKDQLLLEQGALSNQARIQQLAQQRLNMRSANPADVVLLHIKS